MYANRLDTFTKTREDLNHALIALTNSIAEEIGINYPALITAPLVSALQVIYYLRLFLDQLLLIVGMFLGSRTSPCSLNVELFIVALGMALIYSLLIADVDAKVYSSGMLRALGIFFFRDLPPVSPIYFLFVQLLLPRNGPNYVDTATLHPIPFLLHSWHPSWAGSGLGLLCALQHVF